VFAIPWSFFGERVFESDFDFLPEMGMIEMSFANADDADDEGELLSRILLLACDLDDTFDDV
jgi:hypothetical protein